MNLWRSVAALIPLGLLVCARPVPPEMPEEQHLLLQPRGNETELLGRKVSEAEDGQLVIADALAPGCTVAFKKIPSKWSDRYMEASGRVGVFGVGYKQLAGLRVEYGSQVRVEASIQNQYEYEAILEGNCGDQVVRSVLVGTGRRALQYRAGGGGEIGVAVGAADIEVGGRGWREIERVRERSWDTPQAWGFRVGPGNNSNEFMRLEMPTVISSGSSHAPTLEVYAPLWVIVIYADANGNYGVVLPSPRLDQYLVSPGSPFRLPEIRFTNLPGHSEDYERLIVYGFREELDFNSFRPPDGLLSLEVANQYVKQLEQRLSDNEIPPQRWTSTSFRYLVVSE